VNFFNKFIGVGFGLGTKYYDNSNFAMFSITTIENLRTKRAVHFKVKMRVTG
jgi:hypothetical protein